MSGVALSLVAPKARKHLSADALFGLVRSGFAAIPDYRLSETDIALTDALRSAFAMFSLKSPSLLAFDKERAEGNLETIYGIERVPCDTHMREILDPVSPEWLRPLFKSVFRQLQRGKALNHSTRDSYTRCPGHTAITRFRALPVCQCCVARFRGRRRGGGTAYRYVEGCGLHRYPGHMSRVQVA